jgi:hypothetical protein
MPKNKVSEYSPTASNNTDIGGINIAEGCAPSGINNAIRELMAQLKDMQSGTDGDSFTVGGDLLVSGSTSTFTNNVILGSASTSSVTLNAATVSTPNGVNFDANTLVIDAANNRVGVKTASPAVSLDVTGTDAIKIPSGTTAQRPTGATGHIRYNSSNSQFEGYNGSAWGQLGGGATGGGADTVFVENSNAVTVDYTITTNKNAMSAGDITINTGVTVTLPTGSRWVVL